MRVAEKVAGGVRSIAETDIRETSSLPARLALGATMLYHGVSKLRGDGPQQTGQMFDSLGFRPGRFWAVATGVAETFAGAAAVLGIATRPAALAVLGTQAFAIAKVHAPKGFSVIQGGMEFNIALMAIAAGMLLAGPGRLSTHGLLEQFLAGRGPRRFFGRARPSPALRAVRLIR